MSTASAVSQGSFGSIGALSQDHETGLASPVYILDIGALSLRVTSHATFDTLKSQWLKLEQDLELSPFQSFEWCLQYWLSGLAGPRAKLDLVTAATSSGEIVLLMPLVTTRRGGVLVAEMLNDANSAHRTPILRPALAEALSDPQERGKLLEILREVTGADVLVLEQQPVSVFGKPHPLLGPQALDHKEEISDAVCTVPTWDAFDRAHRSSKSRSRDKKRIEALGALGEVSFYVPQTLPERQAFLAEILERKSEDLKSRGVHVFEDPATRDFLMRIAALDAKTSSMYSDFIGLRVGNSWAAAHFGVVHGKTASGLVIAMGMPEAREHSPGHVLIAHVLKHHFESGTTRFSFGLGESDLKKRWTDERVSVASEAIALTPLGVPYATVKRAFWWAKREIKHRRDLFEAVSRVRVAIHRAKALMAG